MIRRRVGAQERAVRKDLRRLAPEDRAGGLAAVALNLARKLDEDDAGLRDTASTSRVLHAVLVTLAGMQEPVMRADPVDELARAREQRRAASA